MTVFAAALDSGMGAIAKHWLAVWLIGLATFVALPWLAPTLSAAGYDGVAGWIYLLYRPTCHQLPHHSWFLFGAELTPDWSTVQPYAGVPIGEPLASFHSPLRHPDLGYQTAICQRDSAIFGSLLLASVAYAAAVRLGLRLRALPLRWYALALVPTAVDGLTQLFGWRESTPVIRSVTGALLGVASAVLILPLLEEGFADIRRGQSLEE